MEPSGLSINPPVKVEWKGNIIYVSGARAALMENKIQFEDRDEFLKAIYDVNPSLVTDPNAKSQYKIHLGDFLQYLKALKARWSDGIPLVTEDEATRRSKICMLCPEKSKANGCYGCSGISKLLMHIPKTLMENTDGCGVCKCYLNNKIWMSNEVLEVDTRDLQYPSNCWIHEASLQQLPVNDK